MNMKNRSTQVLFHVIGCIIVLSLPVIFWPGEGGISEFFVDPRALRGFTDNLLILMFFYLNFYFLIPKFYFRKKYIFFILAITTCFFIIAYLPDFIFPFNDHPEPLPGPEPGRGPGHGQGHGGNRFIFEIGHSIVFFLAVVFFSLLLKINNRLKQTEKEKLKAELSYFKAQINPHFLFNTLNSIYSLALQKDDKTPEAVVRLSGMMRYVITDASHDFVPLEKEIGYISDYIDLQRIRLGDTVKIDYHPCEPDPVRSIAPLILIPFIENAFKFGVNPEADSFIAVRINLSGSKLHLAVFNHKVRERNETEPGGGLGISNARQRLTLLYPDNHQLVIEDGASHFKVDLYINLP
jgi:hypothetical protein